MKIIFIKKPYNSQPDGGDIYNKKIIEGLSRIKDLTVHEYDVKIYNKGLLPFWRWRISKNELINLLKIEKKYDKVIISTVRMVQDDSLLEAIRKEPATSQLRYLLYRLTSMKENHISQRKEVGDYVKNLLKNCDIHGSANPTHSYWLFPIRSPRKEKLVRSLRDSGFDATFTTTQWYFLYSNSVYYSGRIFFKTCFCNGS